MKLVNVMKTAAWTVAVGSLLSVVWILSGIYHHPGRTVNPESHPDS